MKHLDKSDKYNNIRRKAVKLKDKSLALIKPRMEGFFETPTFLGLVKPILILIAVGFIAKLLVFNYLPERKHVDLLGNLLWIYHKDHYCDYLDLNETTQAWLRLLLLIWNGIGLFSLTVEDKEKHNKNKIVYRCLAVATVFIIFTVNNVLGLELFNTFRYLLIIAAFYIGFIEIRPEWLKSPWMVKGMILLIAGSAGNILEHFIRGYVVDYILFFPFITKNYVLNFEDIVGITGTVMVSIYIILQMKRIIDEPADDKDAYTYLKEQWNIIRNIEPADMYEEDNPYMPWDKKYETENTEYQFKEDGIYEKE